LWTPLPRKLASIGTDLTGAVGPVAAWSVFALVAAVLVGAVVARRRRAASRPPPADSPLPCRERLFRQRLALVAGGLGLAYLVLPYSMNFGAFLHIRFLGPALAVGLIAAAPARRAVPIVLVLAAVAVPAATLLAAVPQFDEAEAQNEALATLWPHIPMRSAVAVLRFGRPRASFAFDVSAAGSRALAERGGRLLFSFGEYPIAPAQVPAALRWDLTLDRVYWDSRAFEPTWDFGRVGYALVHVSDETTARRVVSVMSSAARLVAASGEWMLFAALRPPASLTVPDAPLPLRSR
jgi:hypothetical protein